MEQTVIIREGEMVKVVTVVVHGTYEVVRREPVTRKILARTGRKLGLAMGDMVTMPFGCELLNVERSSYEEECTAFVKTDEEVRVQDALRARDADAWRQPIGATLKPRDDDDVSKPLDAIDAKPLIGIDAMVERFRSLPPLQPMPPMRTGGVIVGAGTVGHLRDVARGVHGVDEVVEVVTVESGVVGVRVKVKPGWTPMDVLAQVEDAVGKVAATGVRVVVRNDRDRGAILGSTHGRMGRTELNRSTAWTRSVRAEVERREQARRPHVQTEVDADTLNFGDAS